MRRETRWLATLAAPIVVLGHILSEALASGRGIGEVALEPSHGLLLVLSFAAAPLWFRAVGARRLGVAIGGCIALSLLLEGNGLGAAAMVTALAISAVIGWLGGLALGAVCVPSERRIAIAPLFRHRPHRAAEPDSPGPYYAFVTTRGNRPPPLLLA
jgi:hypothetical protein